MTSRRAFLTKSLALGCSAAANPFITPVTFASAPGDSRLVVIILRGAMDGLDVVRPVGDRNFAMLRGSLARAGRLLCASSCIGLPYAAMERRRIEFCPCGLNPLSQLT